MRSGRWRSDALARTIGPYLMSRFNEVTKSCLLIHPSNASLDGRSWLKHHHRSFDQAFKHSTLILPYQRLDQISLKAVNLNLFSLRYSSCDLDFILKMDRKSVEALKHGFMR